MEILKINNFRYIKSADIALQLIERQEENKRLLARGERKGRFARNFARGNSRKLYA